jgi:hypothetical protein
MNNPTSIRKWGIIAATARRCACVLALALLFLTTGVGSVPNFGTGPQGLVLQTANKPARADTFVEAHQKLADGVDHYENSLSTITRHKTH